MKETVIEVHMLMTKTLAYNLEQSQKFHNSRQKMKNKMILLLQ
jgi:hypothetical protein